MIKINCTLLLPPPLTLALVCQKSIIWVIALLFLFQVSFSPFYLLVRSISFASSLSLCHSVMGRSAARTQFPESTARAIRPSKATTTPRRAHRRRRIKNPSFPGGRRSRPATPLPTWKLGDADRSRRQEEDEDVLESAAAFSSRTLAAALWHSQVVEVGSGGGLGFEVGPYYKLSRGTYMANLEF